MKLLCPDKQNLPSCNRESELFYEIARVLKRKRCIVYIFSSLATSVARLRVIIRKPDNLRVWGYFASRVFLRYFILFIYLFLVKHKVYYLKE